MNRVTKFRQQMVAHGIRKAIVDTIQYIYNRKISPRLPHTRPAEYNSVRVAEHRPATDWWVPFDTLAIEEKYKESNIQAIQETIEAGDRVAIIGGGYGVTAVVAARQAGESGEIQIYEAAKKRVQYIKQTLMLNNVSASVDHAVVGPINHISEELGDPTKISPENIGKFDVMEMDCEGAEVDVLQNLKTKPNAIIVETHGFLGTPSAVTEELLSNNGYKIDWKRPVDEGKKYSEKNDAYVIKSTR